MNEQNPCIFCGNPAYEKPTNRYSVHVVCDRCGEYVLDGNAVDFLNEDTSVTPELKAYLSAMARHQTNVRGQADIQLHDVKHLVGQPLPSQKKRLDALLLEIAEVVGEKGSFELDAPRLSAASYSREEGETFDLLEQLLFDGFIKNDETWGGTLTPEGEKKVSALRALVGVRDSVEYVRSTPTREELEARDSKGFSSAFSDAFRKGPSLNPDGTFGQVSQFLPPIEPEAEGDGLWRLNLNIVPEHSVTLSQTSYISKSDYVVEIKESQKALQELKEVLDGFYSSEEVIGEGSNVQTLPLAKDHLDLVKSLVAGAIVLQNAPVLPRSVAGLMESLGNLLGQLKVMVKALPEAANKYGMLLTIITSSISMLFTILSYYK
ncbi:hypothetical protein [Terasakiella sp.]|uniref:hypothetical protein n=1 Tax=Terasakiella sp. TaxID=2034861 RepID=UPI003AA82EA7